MANPHRQRPLLRPAEAGRFVVLGTALVALLAAALLLLLPSRSGRHTGPRSAAAVSGSGYTVTAAGATVSLATAEATKAAWAPHENGAVRPTGTGEEAIAFAGPRTEEFLTVGRHVGRRTWRWRLD